MRIAGGRGWLRRVLGGVAVIGLLLWIALRPPALRESRDPRLLQREFTAMGTLVSISAYLAPGQPSAASEAALEAAEKTLLALERDASAWGEGALGNFNRMLARGATASVPAPLYVLFDLAANYSLASGGRFDPRVGALVRLWGFDDPERSRREPPPPAELAAAVAALAAAPPLFRGIAAYGPAGVQIDFGAIAKGYAADLAVAQLRGAGLPNAIVNAGGNLVAAGQRGERPWRIGIRHPRPERGTVVLATMDTSGTEAVVTSGDYERWFDHGGRRYHHILDPRSGAVAQGLQSVTVVAREGALADAAATALFIAGPTGWREAAQAMGLDQVLVVNAEGAIQATEPLAARLEFEDGLRAEVVKP